MEIINQQKQLQSFGMTYKPRVVKRIMEQANIPLQVRLETVQNLAQMTTDKFELSSIKFLTHREEGTNKHINVMQLVVKIKERLFNKPKEKVEINFLNGDDRQNLFIYLQSIFKVIEKNRINQKLQDASNVSSQKFKKTKEALCKIYPNQKEYIDSCTPDMFLPY